MGEEELMAESEQPTMHRCPDCNTETIGEFCHVCGERVEPHLLSVRKFVRELFQELLTFDSKFFHTIPALVLKPGYLSAEFVAGRRRRYLIPLRLFVTVAFLSFIILSLYLQHQFDVLYGMAQQGKSRFMFGQLHGEDALKATKYLLHTVFEVSPYVLLLGSTPFFALLLKLLYWKRHRLYVEHLIFSFHLFGFALLSLIVLFVLPTFLWPPIPFAIVWFVLFLVYLFLAMKRFYHDTGVTLAARSITATLSYFIIAITAIFFTIIVAYSIGMQTGDLPKGGISPGNGFHGTPTIDIQTKREP